MRSAGRAMVLMAAASVAACGSDGTGGANGTQSASGTAATSVQAANTAATAAEVAREARGKLRCPAKVKSAPRGPQAPVDDVVGVRPGMTFEEAASVVMCTHDLMVVQADTGRRFNIETYGQTIRQGFSARFAAARVQKTSQQIMREMQDEMMARSGNAVRQDLKPGQTKWYVSTMGMPGDERVIAAAREEWFEEGRNPPIASVEQALLKKYGTPTQIQKPGAQIQLRWAYDSFGRLVTETSPLFGRCHGNASPDGGTNYSPDCSIVVMAIVSPLQGNPELARSMQVGVVDQSGGYERITATEQALRKLDADRRAKELRDAAQNADAPTL